jgi:predicted PurR-regulated permease PerM
MTEWAVLGVIITLFAFVAAVVSPIIKLNTTITKLTTLVDMFQNELTKFANKNEKSHDRIWEELGCHDKAIQNHETRLVTIEKTGLKE